ncbi:MAG: hypothetical protein JW900_04745 [Anaerolineae bacterium]|nr:hypothetical protein [Anaerolineae bacterium]
MIYKVSYVVLGGDYPGAIVNQEKLPKVGDTVELGNQMYKVIEVTDLIPPQGDFAYLHVALEHVE